MAEKGGDTTVAGTGRAESDTLLLGNQELLEPLPLRWWTRYYMLAVYLVRSRHTHGFWTTVRFS
jgi:hypothetical protein